MTNRFSPETATPALTSIAHSNSSNSTDQREQTRSLEFTVNATKLGTWDWHIPSGQVKYNQRRHAAGNH